MASQIHKYFSKSYSVSISEGKVSVVKRTCSFKRPRFGSQHPYGGSQLQIQGTWCFVLAFVSPVCLWWADIHLIKTPISIGGQGKELKARIIWPEPLQVLCIFLRNSCVKLPFCGQNTVSLWTSPAAALTVFHSFLQWSLSLGKMGCDKDVLFRTTGLRVYG